MSMAEEVAREEAARAREARKPRAANGRQDAEKEEITLRPDVLKERARELVSLHMTAKNASAVYAEAVKRCAEKSGFKASVIRTLVAARNSDDFDGRKNKAEQTVLAFEEAAA
jgi:alkylhydroperoxidase family enzyme